MLHDVQDPGNVGAIVRAAEGVRRDRGRLRRANRGSVRLEGAARIDGQRVPAAARDRAVARRRDRDGRATRDFASSRPIARGGTPLPDCDLRMPAAILLGGEGGGLPGV